MKQISNANTSNSDNYEEISFDASRSWTGVIYTQIPSHTHSRGSQNITGRFHSRNIDKTIETSTVTPIYGDSKLFIHSVENRADAIQYLARGSTTDASQTVINFDASRNWTGESY